MRLRTSCDACAARKTRCDLAKRSDGVCSHCRCAGLQCQVLTRAKGADELRQSTSSRRSSVIQVPSLTPRSRSSIFSQQHIPAAYEKPFMTNTMDLGGPRLLQVPGLSRKAMFACIEAFFRYPGAWFKLPDDQPTFLLRTTLLLQNIAGEDSPNPTSGNLGESIDIAGGSNAARNSPRQDFRIDIMSRKPAHELLVLAVIARGSTYTAHDNLQQDIVIRLENVLQQHRYMTIDDLDIVTALAVISELTVSPLHPLAESSKHTNDDGSTSVPRVDMLRLDPLGKGFLAELCLEVRLNYAVAVTHPQYYRRAFLFWVIFANDAIRSASAGRINRISNEDIGWPAPPCSPSEVPFIQIANLARRLCRAFFSARATVFPISIDEKERLIQAFLDFPESISLPLDLVTDGAPTAEAHVVNDAGKTSGISAGRSHLESQHIEQAVLLCLWLRLSLCLWIQLQSSTSQKSAASDGSEALSALIDTFAAQSAAQMYNLAERCSRNETADCAPAIFASACCGWCLYSIQMMGQIHSSMATKLSSTQQMTARRRFDKHHLQATSLIRCVRTMRTFDHAEQVAGFLSQRLKWLDTSASLSQMSKAAEFGAFFESHESEMPLAGTKRATKRNNLLSTLSPDSTPSQEKRRRKALSSDTSEAHETRVGVDGDLDTTLHPEDASSATLASNSVHGPDEDHQLLAPDYGPFSRGNLDLSILNPRRDATWTLAPASGTERRTSQREDVGAADNQDASPEMVTWDWELVSMLLANGIELPSEQPLQVWGRQGT